LEGLAGIALLGPLALHEHCGAGAGQSRAHWGDGSEGGFAGQKERGPRRPRNPPSFRWPVSWPPDAHLHGGRG
jgi:hypothetical protein